MASCGLIWRYWQMLGYAGDQFTCMGCGWSSGGEKLDRAHIAAHCDGGSDEAQNLVLVCSGCHGKTEGWTLECWRLRLFGGEAYAPLFAFLMSGEASRDLASSRTKRGLIEAKKRGSKFGNPKIHLARRQAARAARSEADRFALNVAPLIRPLRDQGLTLAEVAQALDARGVATVRGGSWSAGSVNACVRRAGLLEAGLRAA
jgi:hypothetical protein